MNWETIVQKIADFWNMPVPIIGFTVGTVVLGIIWIISKTSFGKKAINWCKTQIAAMKDANDKAKADYEEALKLKDEIIEKMKQEYSEELATIEYNRELEREFIINALSQINNVRVKKLVKEFQEKIKPTNISEITESIKSEYESKYAELLARLEELENEKGKETINSNSVEETI